MKQKKTLTDEEARKIMIAAGFETAEPDPGDVKWYKPAITKALQEIGLLEK